MEETKKITEEKKQAPESAPTKKIETKPSAKTNKKQFAMVNASSLKISTKHSIDICKMIRNKKLETALEMLEKVVLMKLPVKMNNREVGHRKGQGMMAGRYPINASKEFIRLIKQLNANAIAQGIETEDKVITCNANVGSRQYRRMGHRFKSTNLLIKLETPKAKKKGVKKTK